jgi:hypothetical protein
LPPTLTPPCSAVPLDTGFRGWIAGGIACVIPIPAYAFDFLILTLTKTGPIANLVIGCTDVVRVLHGPVSNALPD